ncbi:HAD-IIB family hydrolase [Auraticoccus sp. F435]|uniref:HAD-IIB family hydrolase n=1 Tax=Auraticoccus cholistanensis TaxID=2656650 RepID=A0A6A9V056_9ACTN|nr:HAD family hydrolase [Auraticoccus cholistanensis]MVA74830.1 HAD-IIB family hydrolase [Auraticoccus cholistanensis]
MVALDIDGTLLHADGEIPAEVRAAVRRVVEAGVPVVLATGRGWHNTREVFEALQLPTGWVVCSNGAVTLRHAPTEVVREVTFDPRPVVEGALAHSPDVLIAVEEVGLGFRVSRPFPEGELGGDARVEDVETLVSQPVTRVVIRNPSATDEDFLAMAEALGLHGVSYFVGTSAWLDIVPEGVSKASALAEVCAALGVDSSAVLALGDGRNDIEMLTWAGRGVALGEAAAEVQAVADHVTSRFVDGGTVEELSRWF